MPGKPLGSAFSIIMHVVQIVVFVVSLTIAFMNLKSDVRSIGEQVVDVQNDVDKITNYLGVWEPNPRAAQR